jgi:hypothetical protein
VKGCSCFRMLGVQLTPPIRTSAVYLRLATFLARTVSEISGELWSIPTNDHKAWFYNEIQHSLRKSLTLSSQALERKKAIWHSCCSHGQPGKTSAVENAHPHSLKVPNIAHILLETSRSAFPLVFSRSRSGPSRWTGRWANGQIK